MNILIATDSHKDFASSRQVGEWIAQGLKSISLDFSTEVLPIGDGGEGTIEAILAAKGGKVVYLDVHDPLFRLRKARVGIIDSPEKTAVIEIAEASGSAILASHERDTMLATSYGTGELILGALEKNCKKIIIGLGGSIVSDGGMGMAQALGARFYGTDGVELKPEKNFGYNALSLNKISKIDLSRFCNSLQSVKILIASDVKTKLLGPNGQATTFGPQKGATPEQIAFIEKGLKNWARVLQQTFNQDFDVELAGAAGGLGSGLASFLSGKLKLGIDVVLKEINFNEKLRNTDIIIAGEGKLDSTSFHGKACIFIAEKAKNEKTQVAGVFGVINNMSNGGIKLFNPLIVANKQNIDVHDADFSNKIGPKQLIKAGLELGKILITTIS